jgi:N-acetylglutamate synthase
MPEPRVEDLERAAALHWQAPETEPLGEWQLRAAAGFTGRANSALPLGDPGLPLPEAVAAVEDWYRRRGLPPMIVLPQGAGPDPLPAYLAERSWVPRPGPAFVMTAEIADLPASTADVQFSPEPDAGFLGLYRYRGSVFPLASGALLRRLLPSSLVPRSSVQSPPRPFGSRGGGSAAEARPA